MQQEKFYAFAPVVDSQYNKIALVVLKKCILITFCPTDMDKQIYQFKKKQIRGNLETTLI